MAVVDELDRLRQSGSELVRRRAPHTTGAFAELFGDPRRAVNHRRPEAMPIDLQLLLDSPGHVRLARTDDEIVDRALALQILAGRSVTVVTYDTSMSMRAKIVGLLALHLKLEIGDETLPRQSTRAARRDRIV